MTTSQQNWITWFEIPTKDIARASKFYSKIFNAELKTEEFQGFKMAMFPCDPGKGVSGCLVQGEGYTPSSNGTLPYLNGGDDLNAVLKRVKDAGGKITKEKFAIGQHGFVAYFTDTEGNRIALHSMK